MKIPIIILLFWMLSVYSLAEDLRDRFSVYGSEQTRHIIIREVISEYGKAHTFRSGVFHKDTSVCYTSADSKVSVMFSSGGIEGAIYLTDQPKKMWECSNTNASLPNEFGGVYIGMNISDFFSLMNTLGIKGWDFEKMEGKPYTYLSKEVLKLEQDIAESSGQDTYESYVTINVDFKSEKVSEFFVSYMESL